MRIPASVVVLLLGGWCRVIEMTSVPTHSPTRDPADDYCCSSNFKDCDDSGWCLDPESCKEICYEFWIRPQETTCSERWQGCNSSELYQQGSCCKGLVCANDLQAPDWFFCQPAPSCCILNQNCSTDSHCINNQMYCENDCDGNWVYLYGESSVASSTPSPTLATASPTQSPTKSPTKSPSYHPSGEPSHIPSSTSTVKASEQPSDSPSGHPSNSPSTSTSPSPSSQPSTAASEHPSDSPSSQPSSSPSSSPSSTPSAEASKLPSESPSAQPSNLPSTSSTPSAAPSQQPSAQPSNLPSTSSTPSAAPSEHPSEQPSNLPSTSSTPSAAASEHPSAQPSSFPSASLTPSAAPSQQPSAQPSNLSSTSSIPSAAPSQHPSAQPSNLPSTSSTPSAAPSQQPSAQPSNLPSTSSTPSAAPSQHPSAQPSNLPSTNTTPSAAPSQQPSAQPSNLPSTSSTPSAAPSQHPSAQRSNLPSTSSTPSAAPSQHPSESPSAQPSHLPNTSSTPRAAGSPTTSSTDDYCCSFTFKDCGSSGWCEDPEICGTCGGFWIQPQETTCSEWWQGCSWTERYQQGSCCKGLICANDLQNPDWFFCQPAQGCCIMDQSCSTIPHCMKNQMYCENDCGGNWVYSYGEDPSPTGSPTQSPTKSPTKSPTTGPMSPTSTAPTGPPFAVPQGPYITASAANELVTIPDPPAPFLTGRRSNCPHRQNGPLLDWHDESTWGSSVPSSGDDVALPADSIVIVRQSVNVVLGTVTIPAGSELVFDEVVDGISFNAEGIEVAGKLTVGSETCRIETPITITLHGNRPVDAVHNRPAPAVKGISVTGELNLHGKRYFRTWTRLALTVEPGQDVIMLQHVVNWEPGQQIVLVTTAMKDSREWHRNEVAIIKGISTNPGGGVGTAIQLEQGVQYQHLAISNYQGEVGLLSRKLKVQGNDASEPEDPDDTGCTGHAKYGNADYPCGNKMITGYGGHIMVHDTGRGFVEGIELYRMGQTNVLGRYPMHFHILRDCPECYFKDSSIHRSFYRCISIHGTHYTTVSENVAYDVTGFCYYLEDGVEHDNRLEFNLGAFIHMILDDTQPPHGISQDIDTVRQSDTLTLPADVAASAFYITNVQNYIRGNAASGGWAGFAFPILPTPVGPHRHDPVSPVEALVLEIDGNTAHSTAWWWFNAAAFYFGGTLDYVNDDSEILQYNAGRGAGGARSAGPLVVTNSKVFLAAGVGLNSWEGQFDIHGFECHDCALSLQSLSTGFWINKLLAVCRTNTPIQLPPGARATYIRGNGFVWYDTGMKHIITEATFRNCGYRSAEYDQYNTNADRGCGDELDRGCWSQSTTWGLLTHADAFAPEIMQATKGITFDNCGRRFKSEDFRINPPYSGVAGRVQNWLDADGTITGLGERSVAASGLADAGMWWNVDNAAVYEPQGPLWFFSLESGPSRGLGTFRMKWDDSLHNQVGTSLCSNGDVNIPCQPVGHLKHLGPRFRHDPGLPVTANAEIVGPVGGFGWKLELNNGAPKDLRFDLIEVDPATPLMLSIAYPMGTSFSISAHAGFWCSDHQTYKCSANFVQVNSVEEVRNRPSGDGYYVDSDGVLTVRIVQTPVSFVGKPDFFIPQWSDRGTPWGSDWTLPRFERDGIRLPQMQWHAYFQIVADCPSSGAYCSDRNLHDYEPRVCPSGQTQTAYDTCV